MGWHWPGPRGTRDVHTMPLLILHCRYMQCHCHCGVTPHTIFPDSFFDTGLMALASYTFVAGWAERCYGFATMAEGGCSLGHSRHF